MYRNPKLLKAAKEYPCQCCGKAAPSVPAHANWHEFGKGTGLKAHDWAVAYLCQRCHDMVDGRLGRMDRQACKDLWIDAWIKTLRLWFQEELVN